MKAFLAARAARSDVVRATFADAFDVFGHPGFAVSLRAAAEIAATHLKEPWSRELEREVRSAGERLGARLVIVGKRPLLVGVRVRGQSVAEAVEAGRRVRAEATGASRRRGRGQDGGTKRSEGDGSG